MNIKRRYQRDMDKKHKIIRDIRIRMEALINDTHDIKMGMDIVDEVTEEIYNDTNLSASIGQTEPHFMVKVRRRSRTYRKNGGGRARRDKPIDELQIINSMLRARAERERRKWEYDNHD